MPARSASYVITLSSIPSRFATLCAVLCALRDQSTPPQRVILYLPLKYKRFPDYDGSLPALPDGVELRRPKWDFGPASKVLHAVREFSDIDGGRTNILFADDDLIYEPNWAERFLYARAQHPDAAICAHGLNLEDIGFTPKMLRRQPRATQLPRWRDIRYLREKFVQQIALRKMQLERHEKPPKRYFGRSGYTDIFEGFAGVLIQPRFFDTDAFEIPDILWTVDDVWLSGMVTKNGIPIWLEADATRFRYTLTRHTDALNSSIINGVDRNSANRLCVQHMQRVYSIWQ
jgi:glycosyltransferase involved in cell wall biosynthesis